MRLIGLAVVLAFNIALTPPAEPQQIGTIPRNALTLGALRQGLRDLGYVQGQNIAIESKWAQGRYDRLPGLAAELVRLKVEIIAT
jgi:hypothetical protein